MIVIQAIKPELRSTIASDQDYEIAVVEAIEHAMAGRGHDPVCLDLIAQIERYEAARLLTPMVVR